MQINSVKNIVVLKSLPSNIVEEAIIILKSNKYAKKFQTIEKNNKIELSKIELGKKEYIIIERPNKTLKEKYQKLRKYSIIVTILFAISFIINFA